jgi:hypothetical protein
MVALTSLGYDDEQSAKYGEKVKKSKETTTMDHLIASTLAAKTALKAPTDQSLRVPCYCEENVWRLAYRKLHKTNDDDTNNQYHVVFVTNPKKCVPMFQQLAVSNAQKPCFWDYHVILFSTTRSSSSSQDDNSTTTTTTTTTISVMDMDSHLPYPCTLQTYLNGVFPLDGLPEEYAPYFR